MLDRTKQLLALGTTTNILIRKGYLRTIYSYYCIVNSCNKLDSKIDTFICEIFLLNMQKGYYASFALERLRKRDKNMSTFCIVDLFAASYDSYRSKRAHA
jgi:hypothetical protein